MRESTPLEKAMSTDPILEFEQISGKSYKDNTEEDNVAMMGYALARTSEKHELLKQANDTFHGMRVDDYVKNITEFGFVEVYSESFTEHHFGRDVTEWLRVFWNEKHGLLLYFDTYNGVINGGKCWYNWKPMTEGAYRSTSSGSYYQSGEEWIWVGDHDCREALRFNIRNLLIGGPFIAQWRFQPRCMWITHWGETDSLFGSYDHWHTETKHPATIRTEERISKFPEAVRAAIKGCQ